MRLGGVVLAAATLCTMAGCSHDPAERSGPLGLGEADPPAVASRDSLEYGEDQVTTDDPPNRIRAALKKLGQEDKIPEGATQEEVEALIAEKVENGIIPREHAEKVLKVLQSAKAHNDRLERLDQQLFGENAY